MVCNREAPSVEAASVKFQDQVNFVGVAWAGNTNSYDRFVGDYSLTFPQIDDTPGEVFERFDVAFQPAFVVVQPDGSLETVAGAVDDQLLEQIISESI